MKKGVVVTGASSGIGRETALLAAQRGHPVLLIARRRAELEALAACCGPESRAFVCDLCGPLDGFPEACATFFEGPIALVHSAGMAEFGGFCEVDVRAQIDLNLVAPLRVTQAILPLMLERGSGHVVNVLSIAAKTAFPGAAAYAASKAGLLMAGQCLAAEFRRSGLRVTSVLPGAVDTPIWEGKTFVPERNDMLTPQAVAQAICDVIDLPEDRSVDELTLMPPKGIL